MKALIWKEWREQCIFLLMAVGLLLCINIGSTIYFNMPSTTIDSLHKLDNINEFNFWVGWMILPVLFALILGASPFSKEFSNNTQDFLLQKPIATARIFWIKFFFGVFLLLFIIQLFHLVLYVPHSLVNEQISADTIVSIKQYLSRFYISFYLLFIFLYSASFFSSLLVKRDLPAMIFSVLSVGIGILYIFPLYLILLIILSPNQLSFLFAGEQETILFLTMCILFAGFMVFSFLIWQKAISKGVKSSKIFFTVTGIIFLIYFVAHTILNISTGLELSRTLKQAKASGVKMTLEEIIPPPVPDEQNAALVYKEAFVLVDKLKEKYKDEWEYIPYEGLYWNNEEKLGKLTREQKENIAKLLLEDEDFIKLYALIEKAVNLPKCRFDIKYEDGPVALLPHLQWIRQLARLVSARTYILTEEKRYKEALDSALISFKLEEALKDEPLFISQLVRIALDGIAAEPLQPIISIFPEEISIDDYQKLIPEIDKRGRIITKGLESELVFLNTFLFKGVLEGDIEAVRYTISDHPSLSEKLLFIFYSSIGRPLLKQDYAFYVRCLTELIKLSQLPYYQAKDDIEAWDRNIDYITREYAQLKYTISVLAIPALSKSTVRQVQSNAQLDGLKLVCALKIYKKQNGYYPDELTALVPDIISELPFDPFTGKDFIYRKEDKGFVVYSLGHNEKDDSGISSKENSEKSKEKNYDREAYDIVWKCKE